jgi:hypothetical protein
MEQKEAELTEFALAVRRLYDTEDGKFVIDQLQEFYVNRRYMQEIGTGVDVAAFLSFREGQKDVALKLMDAINYRSEENDG